MERDPSSETIRWHVGASGVMREAAHVGFLQTTQVPPDPFNSRPINEDEETDGDDDDACVLLIDCVPLALIFIPTLVSFSGGSRFQS